MSKKHLHKVDKMPTKEQFKSSVWEDNRPYVGFVPKDDNVFYNYNPRQARIVYTTDNGSTFKAINSYDWNKELGTPVGVELIPASHNVYGNGKACILALKDASTGIQWGSQVDIPTLTNYNELPNVEPGSNVVVKSSTWALISSTKYFGSDDVINPLDEDTQWYTHSSKYYAPSPYNLDGTRNPSYYQTTAPMTNKNGLSDFNGKESTDKIIAHYGEDNNYAAKAAKKTENGLDWYLPAAGELGYIAPRFNEINEALRKIEGAAVLSSSVGYWSSSEYSLYYAYGLSPLGMLMGNGSKTNSYRVRGVAQVAFGE